MLNPAVVDYVSKIIHQKDKQARLLQDTHYSYKHDSTGTLSFDGAWFTTMEPNTMINDHYWLSLVKVDEHTKLVELSKEDLCYIKGLCSIS